MFADIVKFEEVIFNQINLIHVPMIVATYHISVYFCDDLFFAFFCDHFQIPKIKIHRNCILYRLLLIEIYKPKKYDANKKGYIYMPNFHKFCDT